MQLKSTSEIDVKALQKKLKKKGINCSIEEIEQRIKEYSSILEEERMHKISFVSFISTIVMLLVLAIELQLRNWEVFVLSDINHVLFTIMGFFVMGVIWLRYWLQKKKKYKIARIIMITAFVILVGLIIAMCLI